MKIFRAAGFIIAIAIIFVLIIGAYNVYIKEFIVNFIDEKLELQEQPQIIPATNIFDYIIARNPKITTREVADLVMYAYQLGEEHQIDPYQILAICDIESTFRLDPPVAAAGERGPMQLTPGVWALYYEQYGFRNSDFGNWACNTKVATAHLKELLNQHKGDWKGAIGEYNGGPRWQKKRQSLHHVKKFEVASRGILLLRDKGRAI